MVRVNVNNVLVLSILYLATIARLPLAKLFIASWEVRHGQRRGCERRVSADYPRCATRHGPVGFAVVMD